jgi:hypothetical protein
MKKAILFIGMFLSIALIGCSSTDSNNIDSDVSAPSSISGKTVEFTISSGSGFASSGTWTVVVSNTDNQYAATFDTVNPTNSAGLFTYSANGNIGTISFYDSASGRGHLYLTFISSTSGTYTADSVSSSSANQSGTFVEL